MPILRLGLKSYHMFPLTCLPLPWGERAPGPTCWSKEDERHVEPNRAQAISAKSQPIHRYLSKEEYIKVGKSLNFGVVCYIALLWQLLIMYSISLNSMLVFELWKMITNITCHCLLFTFLSHSTLCFWALSNGIQYSKRTTAMAPSQSSWMAELSWEPKSHSFSRYLLNIRRALFSVLGLLRRTGHVSLLP